LRHPAANDNSRAAPVLLLEPENGALFYKPDTRFSTPKV
jgi:hypothetical protein